MLGSDTAENFIVYVGVCACVPKCTQSQNQQGHLSKSVFFYFHVVVAEQNWEQ